MIGEEIRCSECEKKGFRPTLLGVVEDAEGTLRLWCKRCKKEIKVQISEGKITTQYT